VSRHPLETYLRELQDIRSSGAAGKETFCEKYPVSLSPYTGICVEREFLYLRDDRSLSDCYSYQEMITYNYL